jgi:hypothetical protein
MGMFDIFGKKPRPYSGSSVTAHILDPKKEGVTTQVWVIGNQIESSAVDKFCEDGNVYVVIFYELGIPKLKLCKKSDWNKVKSQFGH